MAVELRSGGLVHRNGHSESASEQPQARGQKKASGLIGRGVPPSIQKLYPVDARMPASATQPYVLIAGRVRLAMRVIVLGQVSVLRWTLSR